MAIIIPQSGSGGDNLYWNIVDGHLFSATSEQYTFQVKKGDVIVSTDMRDANDSTQRFNVNRAQTTAEYYHIRPQKQELYLSRGSEYGMSDGYVYSRFITDAYPTFGGFTYSYNSSVGSKLSNIIICLSDGQISLQSPSSGNLYTTSFALFRKTDELKRFYAYEYNSNMYSNIVLTVPDGELWYVIADTTAGINDAYRPYVTGTADPTKIIKTNLINEVDVLFNTSFRNSQYESLCCVLHSGCRLVIPYISNSAGVSRAITIKLKG